MGDINGDGFDDFIAALQDHVATLAHFQQSFQLDVHPHELAGPSFARIVLSNPNFLGKTAVALDQTAITLRLPAPVRSASYGAQSVFASPGDYNHDGRADLAVAVTSRSYRTDPNAPAFSDAGVYVLYGRPQWDSLIDLVTDADVILTGIDWPNSIASAGDVSGVVLEGDSEFDDLLVGQVDPSGQAEIFRFEGAADGTPNTAWAGSGVFFVAGFEDGYDDFVVDNAPIDPDSLERLAPADGLWHRSSGRSDDPLHNGNSSLYFGSGEGPTGGGNYEVGHTAGRITSGPIPIDKQVDQLQLWFNYFLHTEGSPDKFDQAVVSVSIGNGPFTPVASNNDVLVDPSTHWNRAVIDPEEIIAPEPFVFELATPRLDVPVPRNGIDLNDGSPNDVRLAFALEGAAAAEGLTQSQSVGDVNRDGYEDLMVFGPTMAYVLLGPVRLDGIDDVSTRGEILIDLSHPDGNWVPQEGSGDLNGDGLDDLVFARYNASVFKVFVSALPGSFDPLRQQSISQDGVPIVEQVIESNYDPVPPLQLLVLDFDGQGNDDLLVMLTKPDMISGDYGVVWSGADLGQILEKKFEGVVLPPLSNIPINGQPLLTLRHDLLNESTFSPPPDFTVVKAIEKPGLKAVAADVNGDGHDDLVLIQPHVYDANPGGVSVGQVFVVGTTVDLPTPKVAILGVEVNAVIEDLELGRVVFALGDVNRDGFDDLLIGAAGADVLSHEVIEDAGVIYAIYGSPRRITLPKQSAVEELANRSFTGVGDVLVDPATGRPVVFEDYELDGELTTDFTLLGPKPPGPQPAQEEAWYRFTIVGDGMPGNVLRLLPAALDPRTITLGGRAGH